MKNISDLILLYEEYTKLLFLEIKELTTYAYQHGWTSSRFEEGKQLREEINKLKKQIESQLNV